MKFAVYVLVRLLDSLYGFHNIQSVNEINVDSGRIADQSKDGSVFPLAEMNVQIHALEPGNQVF